MWSAAAVWFVYAHGWTFYYGDAEAHWDIARRILDSRTPGYDQIGTVWLPLPHWLLMPLARVDAWWQSGFAAAIPSASSFVMAGGFLFCAVRRLFDSVAAAAASTALFATNPNVLYLQSIPMTEALFWASLSALLYFTVRFRQTGGWGAAAGAGIACCAGTLTRYEAWFLIPFVAAYVAWSAKRRRIAMAAWFAVLAGLGPAYWLAHNWWLSGDPLEFYRGPYSALAIQGASPYPGRGNWRAAGLYYRTASELCAGVGLWWAGLLGVLGAFAKRIFWPLALLGLPGAFYVWSMHSASAPIFVPSLWPNSFYNTRYGLAVLPLLAVSSGALVALPPRKARAAVALLVVAAGAIFWVIHSDPRNWITFQESRVNSEGRREWVREVSDYLRPRYVAGAGILSASGDFRAAYRQAGIPLRETFTVDNGLPWLAAIHRPDLLLQEEWAVVMGGDAAQSGVNRAGRYGIRYRLEKTIIVKNEPVIEIYRRIGGRHGSA
ncbi:MAG TPA: glycosyltransferase family 39 protein [Bryobacteraceae bacterium]|nr:glycosyltransferase family 39 protein [Bryobacteraceae bacterium]